MSYQMNPKYKHDDSTTNKKNTGRLSARFHL